MSHRDRDSDSEVHFKEKLEEEGVKAEAEAERYNWKVDFEGWVNQFEEYAALERGRESFAPDPLADQGSADVLCGAVRTREDGLQR